MEISDEDLQIEHCTNCNGTGGAWDKPEGSPGWRKQITCPECDGRGVVLTETGAKLYDFVRRIARTTRY